MFFFLRQYIYKIVFLFCLIFLFGFGIYFLNSISLLPEHYELLLVYLRFTTIIGKTLVTFTELSLINSWFRRCFLFFFLFGEIPYEVYKLEIFYRFLYKGMCISYNIINIVIQNSMYEYYG